ncbi:hypothetical protein PCASD_02846 [Puccinia coronata f. sp. avenae]|uniref:Uncharacterized protein n=1 Tax=Puccinia coronata f. sp. avenae TaxID=200324 RepID=A0A2N5VFY4_9BASI|nr:hypothetical protein PCASD_02846 [Puccinia coronata f. sp. avenae]
MTPQNALLQACSTSNTIPVSKFPSMSNGPVVSNNSGKRCGEILLIDPFPLLVLQPAPRPQYKDAFCSTNNRPSLPGNPPSGSYVNSISVHRAIHSHYTNHYYWRPEAAAELPLTIP